MPLKTPLSRKKLASRSGRRLIAKDNPPAAKPAGEEVKTITADSLYLMLVEFHRS